MKPAYQAIAEDVLLRIQKGEWRIGERLPSLDDFCKVYPQSRMTLYKAMRVLKNDGYLVMGRGKGMIVKAVERPQRVAILVGSVLQQSDYHPFAFSVFRYAHAFFTQRGLDAQLYMADHLSSNGLPLGLEDELDQRRLAAMLLIESHRAVRFMTVPEKRERAIPVVHIGAVGGDHRVYVDRDAFVTRALSMAKSSAGRRVALMEREEHRLEQAQLFRESCNRRGLVMIDPPSDVPNGKMPYEDFGFNLLKAYWRKRVRPDVLVVPDDVIAKGVAQAALALRLRVPEDVRIIAMTNKGARFFYPVPVTVLQVDLKKLTLLAAGWLLDLLHGDEVPARTVLIKPEPLL